MESRREDTSTLGADMWMARQNVPRPNPSASAKTAPHVRTITGRTEWGREAGVMETASQLARKNELLALGQPKPMRGMEMPWQ